MDQQKFQELVKKIEVMKKSGQIDLSMEEDLSIAVMNLVSLEEHFFFTAEKTKKEEYFDLLREVREMRKDLLGRLVSKHEGETWCISKHLLATTMRLMEVGTKFNGEGKKDEAKKFFAGHPSAWVLNAQWLKDAPNVVMTDELNKVLPFAAFYLLPVA